MDSVLVMHNGKRWRRRQAIATAFWTLIFLITITAWTYSVWESSRIYHEGQRILGVTTNLDDIEAKAIGIEHKVSKLRLKVHALERKAISSPSRKIE